MKIKALYVALAFAFLQFVTYPFFWQEEHDFFTWKAAVFAGACGLVYFLIALAILKLMPDVFKK